MQSFWFAVLVLLAVCKIGKTVPVIADQLHINNDAETRLIVPPEMTSNYFELLKTKSEKDTNSTKAENADFTPMNFLRSADDETTSNVSSVAQKPLLAFDGSKQTPIFITIPIYITTGIEGTPIIAAGIEKNIPYQMVSKTIAEGVAKNEDKNQQESPSSADSNKQEQDSN